MPTQDTRHSALYVRRFVIGVLFGIVPSLCLGANGLRPIGMSAESIAMGGADLTLAHDTTSLHSNPAGLAAISKAHFDFYGAGGIPRNVRHRDELGNDAELITPRKEFGYYNDYLGFGWRLDGQPLAIGLGLFGQSLKAEYRDLTTIHGTRDNLLSSSKTSSVSAGLGYAIDNRWSIGAAWSLIRTAATEHNLPDTSHFDLFDPSKSFFGYRMEDAKASGTGFRFGVLYQPSPFLHWGLAYSKKVKLTLTGDRFDSNQSAIGLGTVTYRNVRLTGLNQPQELGTGVAIQTGERWLTAFQLKWIDWSGAIGTTALTVEDPNNPVALSTITASTQDNWRDQYVYAVGFAYRWDDAIRLRFGYNYGRNPVPPQTLRPLLAPIGEHHLTLGSGYSPTKHWQIDSSIEYLLPKSVRYTNLANQFGPNAAERSEGLALHLSVAHRW